MIIDVTADSIVCPNCSAEQYKHQMKPVPSNNNYNNDTKMVRFWRRFVTSDINKTIELGNSIIDAVYNNEEGNKKKAKQRMLLRLFAII